MNVWPFDLDLARIDAGNTSSSRLETTGLSGASAFTYTKANIQRKGAESSVAGQATKWKSRGQTALKLISGAGMVPRRPYLSYNFNQV